MTYLSSLRGDIIIEQYEICKWKWLNALATKNGKRSHTDPATEEEEIQKMNEEDNELVDAVIRRYNNPYLLRYIKLYWEDYDSVQSNVEIDKMFMQMTNRERNQLELQ